MKAIVRFVLAIIVIYLLFGGIVSLLEGKKARVLGCEDLKVQQSEQVIWHQRRWEFGEYSKTFCSSYETQETVSWESGQKRNEISGSDENYEKFWGAVYENLVMESKPYIGFVIDSLREIGISKQLSRGELAELVVSFVQDIPYSYVLVSTCESRDTGGHPCVDNVALGILSPYEFLHSEHGDCDTRAVLLYSILEDMGFDPMIVISSRYAHAMLALNLPSSGDHLKYRGKKYYFWETTAKGWPLGVLPPNSNNVGYWEVALVKDKKT